MGITPAPAPNVVRTTTFSGTTVASVDLEQLLKSASSKVADDIARKPEVIEAGADFDPWDDTYIKVPKWIRLSDAVAVVIDLRNSTQLGLNKHAASTASIYEAATGTAVQLLGGFDPQFIAIQGDGAVALFWGDRRYERALCAGVTIKTFSEEHLVPQMKTKWSGLPETGFKVGVAASPLLVKRIGIPRSAHQEPVWPGRAVNYASKAAQDATPGQLVVTDTVWRELEDNEYVVYTCGCNGAPTHTLWDDFEIERIPEAEADRSGRVLKSTWCSIHGPEFCDAILNGDRQRPGLQEVVKKARLTAQLNSSLRRRADQVRNHNRWLAG